MRTTIRMDDELLAQAKALAARSRRSLNSVMEDAVREMLARHEERADAPIDLPTFEGNGLLPGVDLDNTAGLYDLMDADEAS
ncbi:ribbon-helix-helix protein, CopG family [Solicola gregarius]|uniref:Ribbon-helix-helix protein, CopG family n=1 Tax=Solicola gregarius TaxID=2908642 RepID=A0AA46TFE6_9ACTN|nr:ribbon-helix-helix protein, CopG family [Solicola gregarius]UYM04188.1 ribbon-helix-helix protein, CopG family [Solicola gregarius]